MPRDSGSRGRRPFQLPCADAGRIVLRANADTWFLVKDHDGAVLLNRTMKAGETWAVPARSDLIADNG